MRAGVAQALTIPAERGGPDAAKPGRSALRSIADMGWMKRLIWSRQGCSVRGLWCLTQMKSQRQLSRNKGGTPPIKQGFSAPQSPTMAMIFRDYASASHGSFGRSFAAIPAQAPLFPPVHSPHTSR